MEASFPASVSSLGPRHDSQLVIKLNSRSVVYGPGARVEGDAEKKTSVSLHFLWCLLTASCNTLPQGWMIAESELRNLTMEKSLGSRESAAW